MTQPIIVWFRQDLRLADHGALTAAVASGAPVLPVYVRDDAAHGVWAPGGASRWWLHHSLAALGADLAQRGAKLVLRRGDTANVLAELAAAVGARQVHVTRGYEPASVRLEIAVKERLARDGVTVKRFGGGLLVEPDAIRTKAGDPFRVYTPFWRALCHDFAPPRALAAPARIEAPSRGPRGDKLADWTLLPTRPDWARGMRDSWQPGEAGAQGRLDAFLARGLGRYAELRNRPDMAGTSRLSPHLHFGEISPAACWRAAVMARDAGAASDPHVETFLKELAWREFSYHLLFHWPTLPEQPFRPEFARFPWIEDTALLRAWQHGRTGYPIVDAGMRELWTTGWMHNRVRMIVASFLVKDLRIPWQQGEAWFWDTLVDADLASNAASWQWVAGSGADAAPYFRIFNPVTQGARFDPDGDYVRRWVPELAHLPAPVIHAPWEADGVTLAAAGVKLGAGYPLPVADHAAARAAALAAFAALKG